MIYLFNTPVNILHFTCFQLDIKTYRLKDEQKNSENKNETDDPFFTTLLLH